MGCYGDDNSSPSARDMPNDFSPSGSLTIELCISMCLSNGYSYAGLQWR